MCLLFKSQRDGTSLSKSYLSSPPPPGCGGGSNLWFEIIMCVPELHRTLTHFEKKKRGDPCLLIDFASVCSSYIPIFQNFRHDFLPNCLHIWPMIQDLFVCWVVFFFFCFFFVFCFLVRGKNWTHVYRYLCNIHPYWSTSPYTFYISEVPHPPIVVGVPKSDFINLSNASLWEFRNQTMQKVLERGTFFERVILAGTLEWRGTLWVPLSPARRFAHPEPIGVTPLIRGRHWFAY